MTCEVHDDEVDDEAVFQRRGIRGGSLTTAESEVRRFISREGFDAANWCATFNRSDVQRISRGIWLVLSIHHRLNGERTLVVDERAPCQNRSDEEQRRHCEQCATRYARSMPCCSAVPHERRDSRIETDLTVDHVLTDG
ncbi:hypothetical protein [Cryobacterium zongtaii]|uniref:hypothetical protein n=1 Tax=Cryobacterium zongtaii TaxID=1259217 RepID=UPI001056FC5F|nr:hypothetical protein [Cryobacterium zongtaii]